MPDGRAEFFVDEAGRAAAKGTSEAKKVDYNRHVHIIYNADSSSGVVTIVVTDRTQTYAVDHLHRTPNNPKKGGHQEVTVFLRPQSPARIEAEVRRAVDVLKSRARGAR